MPFCKEKIEELFSVGDAFPCGCADENMLCVSAILDDRIQLQPVLPTASEISLEYSVITVAFDADNGETDEYVRSPLHCLISEYRRRADDARREDLIDEMWLSAGVCQIQ